MFGRRRRRSAVHQSLPALVDVTPVASGELLGSERPSLMLDNNNWPELGIFGFDSRDPRSRSFNLLRARIQKEMKARGWRIIGVTSATPGVGKSFISSNIAASLARIPDIRTMLFDLDLRRGSIAHNFGIEGEVGIGQFLAGDVDSLEDTAYEVAGTGLTIFPSFDSDAPSAELLAGQRFKTLVAAMKSQDDNVICICDLPPAFANDDALIIMEQLDAYLFVIEDGRTSARQVQDAMRALQPALCIGTVLNRYRGQLGRDDYGFGYGVSRQYASYYSV